MEIFKTLMSTYEVAVLHCTVLSWYAVQTNTSFSVSISGTHAIGRVGLHGNMVTHFSRFLWPNSVIGLLPTVSGAWLGCCAYNCCLTLMS